MIHIYRSLVIIILSCLTVGTLAQDYPNSQEIRNLMLENWERIEDYEVDIKLAVDIPGFRMPSRSIHYLFKSPDKSKVEVKGFAIIPKQGIQPFFTFLRDSLTLLVVNDSLVNGKPVFEVALEDTFMNEPGKISFFVEKETGNITQAWVSHDGQEFFHLHSEYDQVDGIYLPSSTQINMTFPPDFKNLQRLGKKPTELKDFQTQITDEWLKGSISISFKNYKVNQGLPDNLFEDEAEDAIQD
ncbi:MAG: hypothetical protein K9N29_02905 [Candidatus Marinimicrobia bacterium]|nr:hypothetical protein [Candidatus Neomarinimicrobiota bacterium]